MKIVNTKAGEAYQLTPGTQLEIERPNLFFNEWGEQSLPTDLPDTDLNRRLTNYPDMLANRRKPSANIDCTIQDGDYFMPCRQAILGAKRRNKISTSFYMNEGSFFSRISDVALSDVFGDEVIPGIATVKQGIDFCWSLRDDSHPNFSIFPIIVNLDGDRRFVNRINYMDNTGTVTTSNRGTLAFFNSFERKESVDNRIIKLEAGYYISPFIRATYLLRRIFSHFGYTLLDGFLTNTEPFSKMVFINNTIDSLVNGTIMLAHLVPDCMCNTILDVYRHRFCCEFIPDEVARTVRIELFNDVIDSKPTIDLTPYLSSHPEISYSEYQQLKLSSETTITEGDSYDSTFELEAKYPEAWYKEGDGSYCRTGYARSAIEERLSDGNIPYYAGGPLKAYEVKVPDCAFCFSYLSFPDVSTSNRGGDIKEGETAPYIGDGRTLNSTIDGLPKDDATEGSTMSSDDVVANNAEQKPILAFVHFSSNYAVGTNHDVLKKWGYSLLYNGPVGIYEKFYRKFDNLLRNSLHKVSADLLLPNSLKNSLPIHRKVSLQGVELIFNILKYTIGGKPEPVTSELMTTALYEPLSVAKPEAERMVRNTEYKWIKVQKNTDVTEAEYVAAGYPIIEGGSYMNDIPAIYPLAPTKALYEAGGTYYHRTFYSFYTTRDNKKAFIRHDWSLRPALFSEKDPNERPRPSTRPT